MDAAAPHALQTLADEATTAAADEATTAAADDASALPLAIHALRNLRRAQPAGPRNNILPDTARTTAAVPVVTMTMKIQELRKIYRLLSDSQFQAETDREQQRRRREAALLKKKKKSAQPSAASAAAAAAVSNRMKRRSLPRRSKGNNVLLAPDDNDDDDDDENNDAAADITDTTAIIVTTRSLRSNKKKRARPPTTGQKSSSSKKKKKKQKTTRTAAASNKKAVATVLRNDEDDEHPCATSRHPAKDATNDDDDDKEEEEEDDDYDHDALPIEFDPKYQTIPEQNWNAMYAQLVAFKETHHHIKVPFVSHKPLYHWIQSQKRIWKRTLTLTTASLNNNSDCSGDDNKKSSRRPPLSAARIEKLIQVGLGTSQGPASAQDLKKQAKAVKQQAATAAADAAAVAVAAAAARHVAVGQGAQAAYGFNASTSCTATTNNNNDDDETTPSSTDKKKAAASTTSTNNENNDDRSSPLCPSVTAPGDTTAAAAGGHGDLMPCPPSPLAAPPLRFPLEPTLGLFLHDADDDDDNDDKNKQAPPTAAQANHVADTSKTTNQLSPLQPCAASAKQNTALVTLPAEQQQQQQHQQHDPVQERRQVRSQQAWESKYNQLLSFKQQFGHIHVPPNNNASLYQWLTQQRYYWRKAVVAGGSGQKSSPLLPNQIQKLIELGVGTSQGPTSTRDLNAAMKKQPPQQPQPQSTTVAAPLLMDSVDIGSSTDTNNSTSQQQQTPLQPSTNAPQNAAAAAANATLPMEQDDALPSVLQQNDDTDDLVTSTTTNQQRFENKYNQLLAFKAAHGHISLPLQSEYASLRCWVNYQKQMWKKALEQQQGDKMQGEQQEGDKKNHPLIMSQARIQKLIDIGLGTSEGPTLKKRTKSVTSALKEAPAATTVALAVNDDDSSNNDNIASPSSQSSPLEPTTDEQESPLQNVADEAADASTLPVIKDVDPSATKCPWNKQKWQRNFIDLENFKATFNHVNVGKVARKDKSYEPLYRWVCHQKRYWNKFLQGKKTNLGQAEIDQLIRVGVGTIQGPTNHLKNSFTTSWECLFQELVQFKKMHGHCDVSLSKHKENYLTLARWVDVQRKNFQRRQYKSATGKKKDKLPCMSDLQLERLAGLGFRFTLKNIDLEERLDQLKKYKATHGDTRVPVLYTDSNNLGRWCFYIRKQFHNNKLSIERINKLNEVEFDWSFRRGPNGRNSRNNNTMAASSSAISPSCA